MYCQSMHCVLPLYGLYRWVEAYARDQTHGVLRTQKPLRLLRCWARRCRQGGQLGALWVRVR